MNLLDWPKFLSFFPGLPVATAFAARMIDVDGATGGSLLVLAFCMRWGRKTFIVGDIAAAADCGGDSAAAAGFVSAAVTAVSFAVIVALDDADAVAAFSAAAVGGAAGVADLHLLLRLLLL